MAKQIGPVKIEGFIDGLVFYKLHNEHYVQRQGGPGKGKVKRAPAFAAFRDAGREFVSANKATSLFVAALKSVVAFKYIYYHKRLLKTTLVLKRFDPVSPRGQRTMSEALKRKEGRSYLAGFNFNISGLLQSYLISPVRINRRREVLIKDLLPGSNLIFPDGSLNVDITAFRLHLDFSAGRYKAIRYDTWTIWPGNKTQQVKLKPEKDTQAPGNVFYLLQFCFFVRRKNGNIRPFDGRKKDALCLIAIDPRPGIQRVRPLRREELFPDWEMLKRRPHRSTEKMLRDIVSGRKFTQEEYENFWE